MLLCDQFSKSSQGREKGLFRNTPLIKSNSLSSLVGCPVWLKLDALQPSGSFKVGSIARALLASSSLLNCGIEFNKEPQVIIFALHHQVRSSLCFEVFLLRLLLLVIILGTLRTVAWRTCA